MRWGFDSPWMYLFCLLPLFRDAAESHRGDETERRNSSRASFVRPSRMACCSVFGTVESLSLRARVATGNAFPATARKDLSDFISLSMREVIEILETRKISGLCHKFRAIGRHMQHSKRLSSDMHQVYLLHYISLLLYDRVTPLTVAGRVRMSHSTPSQDWEEEK